MLSTLTFTPVRALLRGAALITLVASGACTDAINVPAARQAGSAQPNSVAQFSNEEVLRGLLFMHGPVADAVPYVATYLRLSNHVTDPQDLYDVARIQTDVIAQLHAHDAGFVSWFAGEARSGDPVRIEHALSLGAERVLSALQNLPEFQTAAAEMSARQIETDQMLNDQRAIYPVAPEADSRISYEVYERPDGSGGGGGGGGGGSGGWEVAEPVQSQDSEEDAAVIAAIPCSPTVCVAGVFLAAGWTAAVAVNYVGGVNVALAVNIYLVWNVRNSLRRSVALHGLQREQFVASIAQTL
ncbi:hypothetical protein [Longimicrobium sp.]|jgi:SdpC family antimicrobial peptide|uniref:hypothetical protein n=1 Tax=Longimicrobium sp. TaxID=2029185 RepID=UPI002F953610